jgi:hypothetical protein
MRVYLPITERESARVGYLAVVDFDYGQPAPRRTGSVASDREPGAARRQDALSPVQKGIAAGGWRPETLTCRPHHFVQQQTPGHRRIERVEVIPHGYAHQLITQSTLFSSETASFLTYHQHYTRAVVCSVERYVTVR